MKRRALVFGLFAGVALLTAAAALSPHAQVSRKQGEELLYYPSGRFLKEAALGYDQAAAAWTWLRTVQYYGAHRRGDRQFDMMYHLCDIVTDLDPVVHGAVPVRLVSCCSAMGGVRTRGSDS